ncbi:hypothetical protein VIGAN_01232000, partial [Vigna angularis var. angularis]
NFQFLTSLLDPTFPKSIIALKLSPFPKSKVAFLFPKIFQTITFSLLSLNFSCKVFGFPPQLSSCSSHHHFQVLLGRSLCVDRQFSVFVIAVAVTVSVALVVTVFVALAVTVYATLAIALTTVVVVALATTVVVALAAASSVVVAMESSVVVVVALAATVVVALTIASLVAVAMESSVTVAVIAHHR